MSSPLPHIDSFNPSSGPATGGTQVTILGQNFLTGCRIKFGGVDVAQVSLISDKKIIAVTPPGTIIGPVNVRIVNPDQTGDVALDFFEYTPAPRPAISSVQPASGPRAGGTQVTITGQSFASGCQVKFEGVPAQIVSATTVQLRVVTPPAQSAGTVTVRVVNPDQQVGIAQNAFTYGSTPPPPPPPVGLPPTILSIDTLSGPVAGATQVTIDGQNFALNCQVKFENNLAQILSNSATRLIVLTPPAAGASLAAVRVINPNQQTAVAQNPFQYVAAPPPPSGLSITSVNPPSGQLAGNTEVTIQGQSFAPGCIVRFGERLAQLLSFSSAQLRVSSPAGSAPGRVNVSVINPNQQIATAANAFEYVADTQTLLAVRVLSPNGRETIQAGTTLNIQWSSTGASQQRVQYSLNGGISFLPIVAGLAGTVQSFIWSVPPNIIPTGQTEVSAIIRVLAQNNLGQEAADSSDEPFRITAAPSGGGVLIQEDARVRDEGDNRKTIVAGQAADFPRTAVVMNRQGKKVKGCVKRNLATDPKVFGFTEQFIIVKKSMQCGDFIETCAEGESGGCGEYIIRITTPIEALSKTYRFDIIGACFTCNPPTSLDPINPPIFLTIKQPRLALSVTPNTPGTISIDAGKNATFSIDADRTSYLGEIQVRVKSVGSPVLEDRSIMLPEKVMQTSNPDSKERRLLVKIKTFAPEPRQELGTPPGTYMLEVSAKNPPHPDVIVTPVRVTLNVATAPDVGIIFDKNRLEVGAGSEAVYDVMLFRYNPPRLRTVETTAFVQVMVAGQLIDLMTTITPQGSPVIITSGTRTKLALKFVVPVDTTTGEYEIRVETKFNTDTDATLQTRTDTAKLIVRRPDLTLLLESRTDPIRAGETAQFKIRARKMFFDEEVEFSLVETDGLPDDAFKVNGQLLRVDREDRPFKVPKGQQGSVFILTVTPPVTATERKYTLRFQGTVAANKNIFADFFIDEFDVRAGRRSVMLVKEARDEGQILMGQNEELNILIIIRRQFFDDPVVFKTLEIIQGNIGPGSLRLEHRFVPNPVNNPALTAVELIVNTRFTESPGIYKFQVVAEAEGIQITPLMYEIRVTDARLVFLSTNNPVRSNLTPNDSPQMFRIFVRRINFTDPLDLEVLNSEVKLPTGSIVSPIPPDMKTQQGQRESQTTLTITFPPAIDLSRQTMFPFEVGDRRLPSSILNPLMLRFEFSPPPPRPPIIRRPGR